MFSRAAEYGITAMKYLALRPPGHLASAPEIAAETRVPLPYLWKILRRLTKASFDPLIQGPVGGYKLARSAKDISVCHILVAVGDPNLETCILDRSECDSEHPCVLHKSWEMFCRRLDRMTLPDVARSS